MILLRMTCVGVGTCFDPSAPVKLPALLMAKSLATDDRLLSTLLPMCGVEQMMLLRITVIVPLTPVPASVV